MSVKCPHNHICFFVANYNCFSYPYSNHFGEYGGEIIVFLKIFLYNMQHKTNDVICVIDRESGGSENLEKHNLVLRSLFKKSELEK